jgi:hypothetical protein
MQGLELYTRLGGGRTSSLRLYFLPLSRTESLKGALSSAPLLAEFPDGTRCTTVCRVFVFKAPLSVAPQPPSVFPYSQGI